MKGALTVKMKLINYYTICKNENLTPFIKDVLKNDFPFFDANFINLLNERFVMKKGLLYLNWTVAPFENMVFSEINTHVLDNISTALITDKYHLMGLYESMNYSYDPIENYSMTEEEKINNSINLTMDYGKEKTVTKNQVNAMDSSIASDSDNSTIESDPKQDTTKNIVDGKRTLTRKGNIGVTTSQQMIESQRQVVKLNLMDEIIKEMTTFILEGIH